MDCSLTYYKDPGLLTDAVKLISINLNDLTYLSSLFLSYQLADKKELNRINSAKDTLPLPPKELLLFFFKRNSQDVNFISHLLMSLLNQDFKTISLQSFNEYLLNAATMKSQLFQYYLDKVPDSIENAENLIRTSSLPDKLKLYLLGFYVHPEPYLYELTTCIEKYYKRIDENYLSRLSSLDLNSGSLKAILSYVYPDQSSDLTSQPFCYSICSVIRNYLALDCSDSQNWIIAGPRFTETVKHVIDTKPTASFETICAALGDINRYKIVNYLHESGSKTSSEIKAYLEIASSSLNHQLRVLKQAGIIQAIQDKSGFHYSLNRSVFNDTIKTFQMLQGRIPHENLEESSHSTNQF